MKFNFFKNRLLLSILILFACNKYTFSKNMLKAKENTFLNYKQSLYFEKNLKNTYKKECFSFSKKDKKHLVIIKNKDYVGFLKNNNFNIFYIVKKNDTLYSISKRLQLNLSELLKYNNFHAPYKILVGQKILVNNISMINNKNINYIIYNDKYKKNILYTNFFDKKFNVINILNKYVSLTEICFFQKKVQKKNIFSKNWNWPIENFNMQFFYNHAMNSEGIEIEGKQGQPVFASNAGKIVYISDIFKNYGKLIIIKHNNNYLSIYGFNKDICIKLNDQVYKHQKISTMGYANNNIAKLYFEVRLRGNSVNLLNLFPKIKLKKH